jgi:hypothetical protein
MSARAHRWPVDVSAWLGAYPFRHLPHPDAETLVRVMERERIGEAWVGALGAPWHRDPTPINTWLAKETSRFPTQLRPTLSVLPGWPAWERVLEDARVLDAPSVRAYPSHAAVSPTSGEWRELASACGAAGLVLQLTVRFEDGRQLHPLDMAGTLDASHIRAAVRADPRVRVIVSGAGAELIAECHGSLTPSEQKRLFWDWAWVWGPPEDHLAQLIQTVGHDRFTFGGYWPLRLIQGPTATAELLSADLLPFTPTDARAIAAAARASAAGT